MKINQKQLRRIIKEEYQDIISGQGTDRYDLYDSPDGEVAAAALDELMFDVSNYMTAARARLEEIKKQHANDMSGISDSEAGNAIRYEFGQAILGRFEQ
jgi:hypothetical protein